jgi:hypothetical protein
LLATVSLLLFEPPAGDGAVFTCASGNVACLIAAINTANTTPEADTITLTAGTYTLTTANNATEVTLCPTSECTQVFVGNGLPQITSPITIQGVNAATTIIERDPSAPFFRLVHVAVPGTLELDALTLRNGGGVEGTSPSGMAFPGSGGGILNEGNLAMANVRLQGHATLFAGGSLSNVGTAVVSQTTVTENTAVFGGGGIHNIGLLTLTNSVVVRNQAYAGVGGIRNDGALLLTNATLSANVGGDFAFVDGFLSATLGVGALQNTGGTALLTNVTVVGNRTAGHPNIGGIDLVAGRVQVLNTILAGNSFSDCETSTLVSLGHNLLGLCSVPLLASDRTLAMPSEPGVGDLVDAGLPGQVFLPVLPANPAIDGGNPAFCPATDQRGKARTGVCDMGAVEFHATETSPAPDLLATSLSTPPSFLLKGQSFLATDYMKNQAGTAGASTTRFYLSLSAVKDSGDVLLTGARAVPSLGPGGVSSGTTTVTVPLATPAGTYFVLACADDLAVVEENNEVNNCRSSGSLVIVK